MNIENSRLPRTRTGSKALRFPLSKFIFASLLLLFSPACGGGGGGGGGSDLPFHGGVWRGTAELSTDSCRAALAGVPLNVGFTHTINQVGREIVIDSGQVVLQGMLDADNANFFTAERVVVAECTSTTSIAYLISPENPDRANIVVIEIESNCDGNPCTVSYVGTGTRS